MCNRYETPDVWEIERHWHIGRRTSEDWARQMAPLYKGPYLRAWDGQGLMLEAGQWGMIPPGSEERIPRMKPKPGQKQGARLSTNNARSERLDSAWTFKFAWKDGRRCLIPAVSFDEPNWESGKNEWWRFRRADGAPWALAGLWSEWEDPSSGEIVPNFTMLTINADAHPLMKRMHRPEVDPKTKQVLPIDQQDKRSVVAIERENWDLWLRGTVEEARALLQLTPVEHFAAGPAEPEQPALV
ncbi:MAG: SOS response-associated peptidase family protein [Variovorax sp.]|nr:SOS response-associated peptidase family protein [Variovorax sp.]